MGCSFEAPHSVSGCLLARIVVEGSCLEPISFEASLHDRFEAHLDLPWFFFCHQWHLETPPMKFQFKWATPSHFPAVLTIYWPVHIFTPIPTGSAWISSHHLSAGMVLFLASSDHSSALSSIFWLVSHLFDTFSFGSVGLGGSFVFSVEISL